MAKEIKVRPGRKTVIKAFEGTAPEGKVFSCWATAPDGSGIKYKPGQTVLITGDLTLFPIFTDAPQEVTE